MLLIYVDEISDRLIYTFDFVFKNQGIEYKLTNDLKQFEKADLPRLNYSELQLDRIEHYFPSTLLFEETTRNINLEKGVFNNEECLVFDGICDPFSAIFYQLSRYEEYKNHLYDDHGRFPAKRSKAYEFGWLEKVMCDRWAKAIINDLHSKNLIKNPFVASDTKIIPTFDIDNTFAYQWKNGSRKLLSILKDYTKGDKKRLKERKKVIAGEMKDPYDTYEYIENIAERGFEVKLFWLLGDYTQFDRNISHDNPRHQRLIQRMSKVATIGIHPSYKSHVNESQLSKEVVRLHKILRSPTKHSRQHFLKFTLPLTYRRLINCGIEHDYSMAYASNTGFRSGTLRPHFWFDLEQDHITHLVIHPIAYMDGTLNDYLKLSPTEAKKKIKELYHEVSQFGGDFYMLWHNETIGEYGRWKGWKEVLEFSLELKDYLAIKS